MKRRSHNRLLSIVCLIFAFSLGTYLILSSLSDDITFFYPPSKIGYTQHNQVIRVGGVVKPNSIKKYPHNNVEFIITDYQKAIKVIYQGVLPNLFRESQGIVAKGIYDGQAFYARTLLTKHDENYKPPSQ